MKCAEKLNQRESFHKSPGVSSSGENKVSHPTQQKKETRKRNSCPLSYVEAIAHAILSSSQRQKTLSEIYSFIQDTYPEFTENRVRWKNTVRHNLSLHECFQRCEIAFNNGGCYWRIHPKFLADFSRGDFSRRKMPQTPQFVGNSWYRNGHLCAPVPVFPFHLYGQVSPFVPRVGMLHRPWNMRAPYGQHPYFVWTLPVKPNTVIRIYIYTSMYTKTNKQINWIRYFVIKVKLLYLKFSWWRVQADGWLTIVSHKNK